MKPVKPSQEFIERIRKIAPKSATLLEQGKIYEDDDYNEVDPSFEAWGDKYQLISGGGKVFVPNINRNRPFYVSYCKRCNQLFGQIWQGCGGDVAGDGNHIISQEYIDACDAFYFHFMDAHFNGYV